MVLNKEETFVYYYAKVIDMKEDYIVTKFNHSREECHVKKNENLVEYGLFNIKLQEFLDVISQKNFGYKLKMITSVALICKDIKYDAFQKMINLEKTKIQNEYNTDFKGIFLTCVYFFYQHIYFL